MIKAIKTRRSIRKYKADKPVTKEQLNELIHAAMLAPSACNTRPWQFIAVTNRKKLDEIADIHQWAQMCRTAAAAIIVTVTPQKEIAEGFYPQDCGAAVQNILLQAEDMGLAACWCGIYPKPQMMAVFAEKFGVKEPVIPFCVIAVGVPDENPESRGFFEESKITYIE